MAMIYRELDFNFEYRKVNGGFKDYFGIPHDSNLARVNTWDVISDFYQKEGYDIQGIRDSLTEEDEHVFRGGYKNLFYVEEIEGSLKFILGHKFPQFSHKNKIIGGVFHAQTLDNLPMSHINYYLKNPEIEVSKFCYEKLESLNIITKVASDILSKRELQCIKLLIQGYTAKQIGENIHLSKRTVESYLESAKNKFGVTKATQLIAKVVEEGIISTHDIF